jgi:hypothetical protein
MIEQEPASWARRVRVMALVLVIGAAVVISGSLIVSSLERSGGGGAPRSMDAATATNLALAFYRDAHAGMTIGNLKVLSVESGPDEHGRVVWKVQVGGEITEPGATLAYGSYMVLYVDPSSGQVRVFAQG